MGKTTIKPGNVIRGGMPSTTGNKSGGNRGNNPPASKKWFYLINSFNRQWNSSKLLKSSIFFSNYGG